MVQDLSDIDHWHGGDLQLSPTGDLARVSRSGRSRQRVIRRLLTAQGDYLAHGDYGSGLPKRIGANLDLDATKGVIAGQLALEASVDQGDAPSVNVSQIPNGVSVGLSYTVAPEQIPAVLSFDVSE